MKLLSSPRASWLLALSLTVTLTACGNNEDNNTSNNTSNNTTATNNSTGGTNNTTGGTNNTTGGTNNTTGGTNNPTGGTNNPPIMADVMEVEDGEGTAASFTAGQTLGGFIDVGGEEDYDFDTFEVTLQAGTIFRWEIQSVGAGLGDGVIVDVSNEDIDLYSSLYGAQGGARETFIPVTGTYVISIASGALLGETVPTHGGATATYIIKTSAEAATKDGDAAVPSTTTGDLNDGAVDIYSVTPSADTILGADLLAGRPPVGSDLDSKIYLWDVAAGEVVGFNDDIDVENENYDSYLSSALTGGKEYWLVIDAYANADSAAYSLSLSAEDDSFEAPGALTIGGSATGDIKAPENGRFDTDYFSITLQPGQQVKVAATASGELQPALYVARNSDDGAEGLYGSQPVGKRSALTIEHPASADAAGEYLVLVDDARNLEEGATPVGGATHGYTIEAAELTPSSTTIDGAALSAGLSGDLPIGEYVWYQFTLGPKQYISLTANTSATDGEAILATRDEDGAAPVGPSATFFSEAGEDLTFGVRDAAWRGVYETFTYPYTIAGVVATLPETLTDVAEAAGNNSAASAQVLTPPARVAGQVVAGDDPAAPIHDYYKVTLAVGDRLLVTTSADPNAPLNDPADPTSGREDADTVIAILDPSGAEIARNDELANAEEPGFSAAIVTAATAGEYTIVVESYYFDLFGIFFNGYYLLNVSVESTN